MKVKKNKQILESWEKAKYTVKYEGDVGVFGMVPKGLNRKLEELEIRRIKTLWTTALLRSARILAVTQSPVKDHQQNPCEKQQLL